MGASRTVVLAGAGAALLAAGFGLGVFLESGAPPAGSAVVSPGIPAPGPVAPAVPGAAAREADPGAPPPEDLSPLDREALRAALSRLPEPDTPSGTGVVTGRVRTEEGAPLPGVEVRCAPDMPRAVTPDRPPDSTPADPDPVDSAASAYRWGSWTKRTRRTTSTDAAGEFRFDGLADLRHQVFARKKGWELQARDWRTASEARPGATVEFVASPSTEVRVEITWPGPAASGEIVLQFRAGSRSTSQWVNPDRPVVSVRPGSYEVVAQAGENREWASDPQTVEIPAAGEAPVLLFAMKGRPGIRGRILFPEGEGVERPQVLVQRLGRDQKADPALFASGGERGAVTVHGEGARYSVSDLAPGRYAVGVARGWNLPAALIEEVQVGDGPVEKDLAVPPLQPGEYVALTVLGPDGGVLRDYEVETGYRSPGHSSSAGSTALPRPDGTRRVLHQHSGGKEDAAGTWWIGVTSPKFGTRRVEYRRGAQDAMTIRFEEPGRVEVRLEGYRGHSHEGRLRLVLKSPSGEDSRPRSRARAREDQIAEDGTQSFPMVQPGEYALALQFDSNNTTIPVARVPLSVKGGRTDVTVKVPPLYTVTVSGGEGWISLWDMVDRGSQVDLRPDAEGRAVFDGLPEGQYQTWSGSKSQIFRLAGITEVRL